MLETYDQTRLEVLINLQWAGILGMVTYENIDLDERITKELESDPTLRNMELVKRLGVNESTISKHISRLKRDGRIVEFTYCDEDGIIRHGRFPLSPYSIRLEPKTDMDINLTPIAKKLPSATDNTPRELWEM